MSNLKNNRWCPKCIIFIGEEITREIMNRFFNCEFSKQKPIFLDGLELDGFNEKLKLAFEYDGMQHYKFIKKFHKTLDVFRAQQQRDILKDILCHENNINLIRVPESVKYENIGDYILEKCREKNITIPHYQIVDYKTFEGIYTPKRNKYEEIKKIISQKGGTLLSKNYVSGHELLELECKEKHNFKLSYTDIKSSKKWCKICKRQEKILLYINKIIEKLQQLNGKMISHESIIKDCNTKFDVECSNGHSFKKTYTELITYNYWCVHCHLGKYCINDMQNIAKKYNGICLSTQYQGTHFSLKWKCSKGHEFSKSPDSINSTDIFCSECHKNIKKAENKIIGIKNMQNLAKKYNGICLSTEYQGTHTPLKWKCCEGHEFSKRSDTINSTEIFCSECDKNQNQEEIKKNHLNNMQNRLNNMQNLAKKYNGVCLSIQYQGTRCMMEWKCCGGHEFSKKPDRIYSTGIFCNECHKNQNQSKK